MSYYELLQYIHVTAVVLSIGGFITRVSLQLSGSSQQKRFWFKKLPHVVDTILLASALNMVYILDLNPFTTSWIAEKLVGLVIYILLGMIALKWGRTRRIKAITAVLAIAVFVYIVYVADSKAPFILFS
jgi:uncharacterized membrane protein SirB2